MFRLIFWRERPGRPEVDDIKSFGVYPKSVHEVFTASGQR